MYAVLIPIAVVVAAPIILFVAPWFAFDMVKSRNNSVQDKAVMVGGAAVVFVIALLIFNANPYGAYR